MANVIEALDEAIETLEEARESDNTDTGTGLLLDGHIRGLRKCKDTISSINNDT